MRYATINLFAALDAKAGTVIGEHHRRHRTIEFRNFLETIEASVPGALEVHLILDNYGTHKTAAIKRWLLRHPRFPSALHPDRWFLFRTLVRAPY
jgi:DDE superfamily endonuclease